MDKVINFILLVPSKRAQKKTYLVLSPRFPKHLERKKIKESSNQKVLDSSFKVIKTS